MTTESKILDLIKDVSSNLKDDDIIKAEKWSDLNFNSLDIVEIILNIEDKFGIEIPDDEAETLRNYNILITYLKGKKL
jgi:acyl carrier protein